MDAPAPGGLGGTYGGNPVACAAALAVFEAIEHDNLLECATALGERLRDFIEALQHESALGIGEIRGLGGMSAFERSEEHTSELQSLMRISYAVFCLKKKKQKVHNLERTNIHKNIPH